MTRADEPFAAAAAAFGVAGVPRERVTKRVMRAGDVALKVFDAADGAAARVEVALLAHLATPAARGVLAERVRVQALCADARGAHIVDVGGGAVAIATSWVSGEKRGYAAIDDETWGALGSALAALHDGLGRGNPFALPDLVEAIRARDLGRERATLVAHRAAVERGYGARFDAYFDDRLRLLDAHGPASQALGAGHDDGALHNDYNEHNYLFASASPPLILDFERAVAGPRALEVVRCLNHLPLLSPERARAFVDGYVAHRPLDRDDIGACVDAALTAHAVKHWPVELLLRGEPGAIELVEGMAAMVHALARGASALRRFFEEGAT